MLGDISAADEIYIVCGYTEFRGSAGADLAAVRLADVRSGDRTAQGIPTAGRGGWNARLTGKSTCRDAVKKSAKTL